GGGGKKKGEGEKENGVFIKKGHAEENGIFNGGMEKARGLSLQTEDMKRQSNMFRSRFRMLLEAQLDLLKRDDWEDVLKYDLDAKQVTEENFKHLHQKDSTAQKNQAKKQEKEAKTTEVKKQNEEEKEEK
ncbi:DivIVA domain-containing protein, partial [Staphylococcus hyicus]